MASRSLNVVITGDARSLNRALGSVDKSTGQAEGRLKKFAGASKLALAGAAGAAGVFAIKVGSDSVKAAMDAEAANARMTAQLKASGISYQENAKHIDSVIQKTSNLAGLDDEQLQDAFTNIVRVTGNVNQSLRLTGLAADFARAKHMDVAKAGEIVGKVAGGNTGILGRYGIKIREGATATQALGELQRRFAGQAEAYGKTAAGAQDRFKVATENLKEALGNQLLPVLTRVLDRASSFVDQMRTGTGAGGRFRDVVEKIGHAFEVVWPVIRTTGIVVGKLIENQVRLAGAFLSLYRVIVDKVLGAFSTMLDAIGDAANAASKIPVVGKRFKGVADAAHDAASKINKVRDGINSLHDKKITITTTYRQVGRSVQGGGHDNHGNVTGAAVRGPNPNPGLSLGQEIEFATADVNLGIFGSDNPTQAAAKQRLLTRRISQINNRQNTISKILKSGTFRGKRLTGKQIKAFRQEFLALEQEESGRWSEFRSLSPDAPPAAAGDAPESPPADTGPTPGEQAVIDAQNAAAEASLALAAQQEEANRLQAENTAAIAALRAEQEQTRRLAESAIGTQSMTAWKAFADIVSGQIAGFGGYAGRAATAGAGSTWRL